MLTASVGIYFRAKKIILMLTWRLNYGGAACNYINYTMIITKLTFICRMETHVHRNKFQFCNHDPDDRPCTSNILERIDEATLINNNRKRKIASVPAKKALLVLLSMFYAIKKYTEGFSNFYQTLEIISLGTKRDSSKIRLMVAVVV